MKNEIARLLNLFCSDKVKLQQLLSDYLEENGEDSEKENDVDSVNVVVLAVDADFQV